LFELQGVHLELGERPVLRDITFTVTLGERIVLLGINGCGKTSLLKALDGLLFPVSGTMAYEGLLLEPRRLTEPVFRRRFRGEVVLLFQNVDAMLFNPTVAEEIAFGPRQLALPDVEGRVGQYARLFQVESLLERPPFELSGGEKKRVALAAILAIEPKVLLLDEPTANLDPATAAQLIDFLAARPALTTIVSTQNLSVVEELGGRALVLSPHHPGLLYDGPSSDLLNNRRILEESGLAHRHHHRHGASAHEHFHLHSSD
jgi:cobalt/nickel transport system ATP-binding protein